MTPDGYVFAAGYQGSGIFLSPDSEVSWNEVYTGSLTPISWAAGSNGYVYAGIGSGILRTTDNGNTWVLLNNGLTNNLIFSLSAAAEFRASETGAPPFFVKVY